MVGAAFDNAMLKPCCHQTEWPTLVRTRGRITRTRDAAPRHSPCEDASPLATQVPRAQALCLEALAAKKKRDRAASVRHNRNSCMTTTCSAKPIRCVRGRFLIAWRRRWRHAGCQWRWRHLISLARNASSRLSTRLRPRGPLRCLQHCNGKVIVF